MVVRPFRYTGLFGELEHLKIDTRSIVVYYESRKRELKTRPMYECQCDERLKTKSEKSTHLAYTRLIGQLEHLKIETRLIDEMFVSVMGDTVWRKWNSPRSVSGS